LQFIQQSANQYNLFKTRYQWISFIFFLLVILTGCAVKRPSNINNACSIVNQKPGWYEAAHASYQKWGVPVSVQFAIIRQESSFRANAQPRREHLLGFIPWTRVSSAYGYAQALDGTWKDYKDETDNYFAERTNFSDSVHFIGWYGDHLSQQSQINKTNAKQLYLGYHEGALGYNQGRHHTSAGLIQYADQTQKWAWRYASQLKKCDIPDADGWF
jgi:hypothetical protein